MKASSKSALALLVLFLFPAAGTAEERWYVFSIAGTPVGYMREETEGTRARTEVFARLSRLGKSLELRFETATTEDADGNLETLEYEAQLSKNPMRVAVRLERDRIVIATPPHERAVERGTTPVIGPLAAAKLTAQRLLGAGDEVEYALFSPELQRVVKVRRRLVAIGERVQCNGATARRIEETVEGLPAPRTVWVDGSAVPVADSVAGPFGPMATCRASKESALAANGTLPADAYEKTLARSNVRLADPFAVERIVLRIRPRAGAPALPDFAADTQRVLAAGLVEIARPERRRVPGAPPADREFLEPNALVESANEDVARIARELKRPDEYDTAIALTTWTADNLSLDGGIVMAPASELVRDRRATCMGYATLLAALARAAGLPSRVAMGYVYYGGIWGGHAWTEMRIDGQWLPFDAAVFAPEVASATRLAVGASSLADGAGSLTAPLARLFGQVEIEVVEYEAGGGTVRVEPGEPPYRTRGGRYVNRGLGIRIEADGWTVERADATWPSTLVVAFRRGATSIELHQRPRFPERPVALEGDAAFAAVEGGTRWVWTARGPDAAAALPAFLARVVRER